MLHKFECRQRTKWNSTLCLRSRSASGDTYNKYKRGPSTDPWGTTLVWYYALMILFRWLRQIVSFCLDMIETNSSLALWCQTLKTFCLEELCGQPCQKLQTNLKETTQHNNYYQQLSVCHFVPEPKLFHSCEIVYMQIEMAQIDYCSEGRL